MTKKSTPLALALSTMWLVAPAWAEWEPDPTKEYILTNLAEQTPLAATGDNNRPYQGAIGEVTEDTRWVFTPAGDGTYYIDRAAGGTKSRLQLGGSETPKMKPSSNTGSWVKFSLVDAGNDKLYVESGAPDPYRRLRFDEGAVEVVAESSNGWKQKFRIREAENIINDKRWMADRNGALEEIRAGKGGQLTRIGGTWYWVGTNPAVEAEGGDLHLYASDTLGDGTWRHVTTVLDVDPGEKPAANCKLVQHPENSNFIIVCKGDAFYVSDELDGNWSKVETDFVQTYKYRSTFDSDGEVVQGDFQHKFGGGSLFIDDDGEAYYITSRLNLDYADDPRLTKQNRNVGIYRLQDDWLDFEEDTAEVYWGPNKGREAMFLFKRNDVYYMMSSHTGGWDPSRTYYRTSDSLAGPWSEEERVAFVPNRLDGGPVMSHGVQFRYMIDLGNDRWMFGGDRYAIEEAEKCAKDLAKGESCTPPVWNPEYGRHMRLPVVWDEDGVPTVYWREEWNVGVYDYTDTTSEVHDPIPGVSPLED